MSLSDIQSMKALKMAKNAQIGSQAGSILMNKLSLGIENVVVYVTGDSTGVVGTNPWTKQTASWLASQFPAYTVNYRAWNDTTQTYDALGSGNSYVVQTGNGTGNSGSPFILDFYNASVSGSAFSYPMTTVNRWNTIFPATPTLFFINYGHNTNGSTNFYRYQHFQLCRSIQEAFPEAGVIQIAQNPRASTDAEKNNDLFRARTVMSLSASEGYGLVNVTQRFLSDSNYATNLLNGDGLHPNETGSTVWANEVVLHLLASVKMTPRNQYNRQTRVWIPAYQFSVYSGTPTLSLINNEAQMWTMNNGVDSSVVAQFDLPSHWSSYDAYIFWTMAAGSGFTSSNNTCKWRTATQIQGLGLTTAQLSNSVFSVSGWSNQQASPISGGAINLAPYSTFSTQMVTDGGLPTGRPSGLKVTRVGTDIGDNTGTPVYFMGVLLVRAR